MRAVVAAVLTAMVACGGDRGPFNPSGTDGGNNPPATFSVQGAVYDSIGRTVTDARVEILDGPHQGAVAMTDIEGRFAYDRQFTHAVMIRASKEGYREQRRNYAGTAGAAGPHLWFRLGSTKPPTLSWGGYRLTFSAAASCANLPSEVRQRTYTATLGGTESEVIALGDAQFASSAAYGSQNVMYLSNFEELANFHFSDPPVLEQLGGGAWVQFFGAAEGSVTGSPIQLPAWARVDYCAAGTSGAGGGECAVPLITCQSADHALTLLRR